jgi:hypothetical protein
MKFEVVNIQTKTVHTIDAVDERHAMAHAYAEENNLMHTFMSTPLIVLMRLPKIIKGRVGIHLHGEPIAMSYSDNPTIHH